MSDNKIRVGITQGDMNGIGPEVIIKALSDPAITELITPVIYSSVKVLQAHRKSMGIEDFGVHVVKPNDQLNPKRINLVPCTDSADEVDFGKPSEASGRLALRSIDTVVEDLKREYIDVMVSFFVG